MDILTFIFEIIGIITYAVSGAMTAAKKRMDMFGAVTLGVITAVGGGIMRDITLGRTPPAAFTHPIYVGVSIISSMAVLVPAVRRLFMQNNRIYEKVMFLLDTVSLGLFTAIGVGVAFDLKGETNMFLTVFVGVITGVGGGVLRDVLSGSIPYIFVKHIYACASIVGAIFCALFWDILGKGWAMLLCIGITCIIRILSAHFKWNLPISK